MAAATETTRAIALIAHALRQSAWVQRQPDAQAWLDQGRGAEASLLRHCGGSERLALPLLRLAPLRRLMLGYVDHRVPGTTQHLLWRKVQFHRHALTFLRQPGQVICLGAGLDPLGWHLARQFPHSQIIELDRPELMAAKRRWTNDPARQTGNLRLIDADLTAPLATEQLGLDPGRRVLLLAEGLLMYLPTDRARQLLDELLTWAGAEVQLLFSCLDQTVQRDRHSSTGRLTTALRRRRGNEAFTWAMDRAQLPSWLASLGLLQNPGQHQEHQPARQYGEFLVSASTTPSSRAVACRHARRLPRQPADPLLQHAARSPEPGDGGVRHRSV